MSEELPAVIRYLDPASGDDLGDLPDGIRPYIVQSYAKRDVAILVSDMSGFTKLTRKHGVIHFTSIIARTRQLCLPILHRYGATFIAAEGDNLIVVFLSACAALRAACEMQQTVASSNALLTPDRAHFTLTLAGIGVHYGPGPMVDKTGKLHGKTFEHAYLIGEEMCDKGSVALSSRVREMLAGSDGKVFEDASFRPKAAEDGCKAAEAVAEMGGVFEVVLTSQLPSNLTAVDDATYMSPALLQFTRRHQANLVEAHLASMDADIRAFALQRKAVLMFELEPLGARTQQEELALKFDLLAHLSPIFSRHNAQGVEDVLYLFNDAADAVLTAIACRRDLAVFNKQRENLGLARMQIKGYGIHVGDVLLIAGTDVHWGDPVNTASKLGQDLATDGELIISEATYEACGRDSRLRGLLFRGFELEMSGVKFKPFRVYDSKQRLLGCFEACKSAKDRTISRDELTRIMEALQIPSRDFRFALTDAGLPVGGDINIDAFLDWVMTDRMV